VSVTTKTGGEGCVVTTVTPGDAAATAGLVTGDVITTVGGIAVPSMADFNFVMQDRRPGDNVTVIWHDASGAQHTAVAVLSAGPPA
jgi:S1-C subfamily serine protease